MEERPKMNGNIFKVSYKFVHLRRYFCPCSNEQYGNKSFIKMKRVSNILKIAAVFAVNVIAVTMPDVCVAAKKEKTI